VTKAELVQVMAEKANTSKAVAKRFLDTFTDTVAATLKAGDKVTMVGFGTFTVTKRKPRKGRNPRSGKEIQIPGGNTPRFKAGKALKEKVG
jgi:DNA-binding protein HU-beta